MTSTLMIPTARSLRPGDEVTSLGGRYFEEPRLVLDIAPLPEDGRALVILATGTTGEPGGSGPTEEGVEAVPCSAGDPVDLVPPF